MGGLRVGSEPRMVGPTNTSGAQDSPMASDPIPFDRSLAGKPDDVVELSPLVRRLIANNGGPFTFTGTCSYLVGRGTVTIIDPGPADPQHQAALLKAIGSATIERILVTHTHRDHAPGAASLKAITGAPVMGCAPYRPASASSDARLMDASHDLRYAPDRVLDDGAMLEAGDHRLAALATPGHTANHLSFVLDNERAVFTGDHVMAWSTTVIAPPDGSMRAYFASLERLLTRPDDAVYWPGHGGPVRQPQRFVRALAHHRRQREHSILARVRAGDSQVDAIVRSVYDGLAPALRGGAALSVLAHLIDLADRGMVEIEGEPGLGARIWPAGRLGA